MSAADHWSPSGRAEPDLGQAIGVLRRRCLPAALAPALGVGIVAGALAGLVNPVLGLAVLLVVVGTVLAVLLTVLPERRRQAVTPELSRIVGGRDVDSVVEARVVNLVESLVATLGVPEPTISVIDDPGANLATFGPPGDSHLVVTTGLTTLLTRVEAEAVLAEALWRIRSGDAEIAGVVAAVFGGGALETRVSAPAPADWVERWAKVDSLFSELRHIDADAAAVGVTRYPPALATALLAMERVGTSVASATWGTAGLWMCDPGPGGGVTHPSVGLRVSVLDEL